MRKLTAIFLCAALLCAALPGPGALAAEKQWTRTTQDGKFVTIRVPYEAPDDQYYDSLSMVVRYKDTGEIIPASAADRSGEAVFATVPAGQESRELEAVQSVKPAFQENLYDLSYQIRELAARGVFQGNDQGRMQQERQITRAEAVALVVRMLGISSGEEPGYGDVSAGDWFYDAVAAGRAYGIVAAGQLFYPSRPVTRQELTVMVGRAYRALEWAVEAPETWEELTADFGDADKIASWARGEYASLLRSGVLLESRDSTGERRTLEPQEPATRKEAAQLLFDGMRFLPVYPTAAAIQYGFDREMPVIDGSTSTYPYTRAVYGALFSNSNHHLQFPAAHSKSYYSYERLINGDCDLLFSSTKPTEDTLEKARKAGVELELIPMAYDAMVFFTNEENSLDSLTMEQIEKIYVENAYDNWRQVGGPDAALLPYCRNSDSGSQAQIEEYFLHGREIHAEIRQGNVSTAMSSALTDVGAALVKEPPAYALGYSIYYYYQTAEKMMGDVTENRLKLLKINGVAPSDQTIADGSYPLSGYNYIVLRADEPQDSAARAMVRFMLSAEGQQCVDNAGFGPLK